MGSPSAIPIRLPTTLPFPSTSSKAETPSSSSSQPRPRPHKQQAHKPVSSIASGEQNIRRDPAVAQRNKQKHKHKKNLKKIEIHKTKQATSAPSPQSAKPHPKKQKTKQFQHPNQQGNASNDGQGPQRAKSASQGPSTPQSEQAHSNSRSGSASPAPTLRVPTPIREADKRRSSAKPSPSRGIHRREIEGNVEIQDEAGQLIDIGQHGELPFGAYSWHACRTLSHTFGQERSLTNSTISSERFGNRSRSLPTSMSGWYTSGPETESYRSSMVSRYRRVCA